MPYPINMQFTKGHNYLPPKVTVIEIKSSKVLCASQKDASNNGYNSDDYEW